MSNFPGKREFRRWWIAGALLFCAWPTASHAQTNMGTITGLVTDRSEAVLPGASVVARNTATGAEAATLSSSTGNYVIPNLPVGSYEVTVSQAGFKSWSRGGIALSAGDTIRVDAVMEVG